MLISYRHKFLFIHVGKTAGSSIQRALEPYADFSTRNWWRRRLTWLGSINRTAGLYRHAQFPVHTPAAKVQRCLPPAVYNSLFKFAFVRNPWDSLVSRYFYLLQSESHHRHRYIQSLGSFEAYLDWELVETSRFQSRFLTDRSGNLIVDFIGRFETLEADFAAVCRKIGIEASLPRINTSEHRDYREYYNDRTRARVAEHFQRDIELLGYSFDSPLTKKG